MTITFDEAQHPREPSGRFTAKAASESKVDLDTQTAATQARVTEHEHSMGELNMLERTLAAQLSQVRTDRMKHDLAVAVTKADAAGTVPPGARYVAMRRDEDYVNDYGSVDCVPSKYLDGNGRSLGNVYDTPAIHHLVVSLYADESGPDLYDEDLVVWRDDIHEDAIDLEAVRGWSSLHSADGSAELGGRFAQEHRTSRELTLAGEIRDMLRDEFPSAHTVYLEAVDDGTLTYDRTTDADGNVLHEMYATETGNPYLDDDLSEKVREMTQDQQSVDTTSSWPSMIASAKRDDHTGCFYDVSLDLTAIDSTIPQRRPR